MGSIPLRILFAGTPEFAALHLNSLLQSQHEVVAVYTQPDRPSGRGKRLLASPVKRLAETSGLPVLQPPSLRDEVVQRELADFQADLLIVVAYGLILPEEVLTAPGQGCLNVHASLLPRWRGAAPIQRAIEAGDDESGITIMQMDRGLDTGNMLARASCPIGPDTTAAQLHDTLAELGAPLLLEVLDHLSERLAGAQAQNDSVATYAAKIQKSEAQINWSDSAELIARKIRAFNPFPIAYTFLGEQRLKIHQGTAQEGTLAKSLPGTIVQADPAGILIACGVGQLRIERLQLPGGKALDAGQLLNAKSTLFSPGTIFGKHPQSAVSV